MKGEEMSLVSRCTSQRATGRKRTASPQRSSAGRRRASPERIISDSTVKYNPCGRICTSVKPASHNTWSSLNAVYR